MPKEQGVVGIGLKLDYEKALQKMNSEFQQALTKISNSAKKVGFDADIKSQIKQVNDDMAKMSENFKQKFEEINSQTINTENFEKYQAKVSKNFSEIKESISLVTDQIDDLNKKVGLLDGSSFAASMKAQFEGLSKDVLDLYNGLKQVVDITKTSSKGALDIGLAESAERYNKTLNTIKKIRAEIKSIQTEGIGDNVDIQDEIYGNEDLLEKQLRAYKKLNNEIKNISKSSPEYAKKENQIVRVQIAIEKTIATMQRLNEIWGNRNDDASLLDSNQAKMFATAKGFREDIDSFISKAEKMSQASKDVKKSVEQVQGAFNTFQIKDGAIHIPIDIATKNSELKDKIRDIIQELKTYADKTPVVARVKLILDKGSSTGYEKNSEVDKQQVEGQNEPAIDIAKAIQKTYRDAAREAKQIVKTEIKNIQEEFENVPIKIKPDTDAFTKDLKKMINSSFRKISEETSGVKVNEELEKLVANLKEVSTSLSGNENFKFGLDEASIKSITDAIKNMADMIQRAFGVASNDDIAAQWAAIESKFKGVAGEEGKLLKGNKEHKIAIQELAVEYKKYLDMGGKNDLSELTTHKQTIKNIAAEYESLGKAAQEAAQQQEKVAKKPASKKVSSEEADAIKGITKQNKNLETQAGKTGTALDNESKVAQTAAERFAELAEKKKAATDANLELGIAAEMTAEALKKEAEAQKEAKERKNTAKSNKNAIDEGVYSSNFLKWQDDIERSLKDSGNYADVYEAKISQATNGTVKFTAVVRTLDGELKKFSVNVRDTGEIFSPSVSEMGEKQAADFEKRLKVAEKIREAIANMDGEGEEPIRLDRSELELYSDEIQRVLKDLEELSGTTYKVDITSGGKLAITRKEIAESGAEAEQFTVVIDRIDDIFEETADGIVVSSGKIEAALNGAFDSAKISTSTKDLASKAQDAFDTFYRVNKNDINFGQIEGALSSLKNEIANIDSQNKLEEFKLNLKDLAVILKNFGKDSKLGEIIDENKTFGNINEVRANINSLFASIGKVNEKSIRVTGTDKLTAEVKLTNGELRKMAVSLDSNGFARFVDKGIVEFGRLRSVAEGVFKGIQSMVRIYLSPQDFIRYFRQGFDKVLEVDTAMTELKKVSDAPMGDNVAYFDDAVVSAKKLGSTVKDMISATADWSRLGYNLPDSRELGEVAVLYKNVGDGIDIDAANESLVSTIQGFQLQAKDAMSVIDAFNEVSNNYAISSAGIGEALKRSAAAFNAANTDLNQSIALITAGNEIVQSPEKVGTMWQTVSARIRGTKSELEELGETTDDLLSTSKLQSLVKGYTGVDIMKDKDTYKDIYTIVSEIGEKWKDLKDVERAALLEGLAGKKQSNTLAAVLNNAERLEEIYQTAENSMGSAEREQQRYAQSIQYSLDQLTAHGEDFWNTFINKDDVKKFIDLINTLISGATKLVDTFDSIPTVAGILGGFAAIKNVGRPKMFGLKLLF